MTNAVGTLVSAPVSLTILSLIVPPAVTSQPYKSTATVGSPASFTVGASGTGPISFQWLLNGAPIAGATAQTLTLPSVQVSDAGTYSAVVTNARRVRDEHGRRARRCPRPPSRPSSSTSRARPR